MPRTAPKRVLQHGGPPSDFRVAGGVKQQNCNRTKAYGAIKRYAKTCCGRTTEVCSDSASKSHSIHCTPTEGIFSSGSATEGPEKTNSLQKACPFPSQGQYTRR